MGNQEKSCSLGAFEIKNWSGSFFYCVLSVDQFYSSLNLTSLSAVLTERWAAPVVTSPSIRPRNFFLSWALYFPLAESNKFPLCISRSWDEEEAAAARKSSHEALDRADIDRKGNFYCTFHNITRESCKIYVASSPSASPLYNRVRRLCIKKLFIVGEVFIAREDAEEPFELCRQRVNMENRFKIIDYGLGINLARGVLKALRARRGKNKHSSSWCTSLVHILCCIIKLIPGDKSSFLFISSRSLASPKSPKRLAERWRVNFHE